MVVTILGEVITNNEGLVLSSQLQSSVAILKEEGWPACITPILESLPVIADPQKSSASDIKSFLSNLDGAEDADIFFHIVAVHANKQKTSLSSVKRATEEHRRSSSDPSFRRRLAKPIL